MPIKKKTTKKRATTARKRKVDPALAAQELRDAVERLPDIPMPGAPIEIPKDLPDPNPVREPTIIPAQTFYARGGKETGKLNQESRIKNQDFRKKYDAEPEIKKAQVRVWLAVAVTFLVIALGWAATLKGTFYLPNDGPKIGEELHALKDEWEDATENIKNVLQQMNSRLSASEAKNSPESEEVLKAIGARVIFEAGRATSTE